MTATATQVDLAEVGAWIDILHGNSPGLVHICASENWSGATFSWHSDRVNALEWVRRNSHREGVYLRATTVASAPGQGKRGKVEDSVALPGLWADIDLAGIGHKYDPCTPECTKSHVHQKDRLPATPDEAQQIIYAAGLPKPSLWIHSGGGLYPYWIFDNPVNVSDPEARATWAMASQVWQNAIGAAATKLGLHYGTGIGDLARVLRIPGTVNRKEGGDRPCRMLRADGSPFPADQILDVAGTLFVQAETPKPAPLQQQLHETHIRDGNGSSAGDLLDSNMTFAELLNDHSWSWHHADSGQEYWVRPGKVTRGHSASVRRQPDGSERLFVFSDDAGLPSWEPLTLFYVYAQLEHAGNMKQAAKAIHGRYGPAKPQANASPVQIEQYIPTPETLAAAAAKAAEAQQHSLNGVNLPPVTAPGPLNRPHYCQTSVGNAERMCDAFRHDFRYIPGDKMWMAWDGRRWTEDPGLGHVTSAVTAMTYQIKGEAETAMAADPEDKAARSLYKWSQTSQMDSGMKGTISQFSRRLEVIAAAEDFDNTPGLLNLPNGVYDLDRHVLLEHDRKYMATQVFGAPFDPRAECPKFRQLVATLIPDDDMRGFVQRAVGYSLLGRPNQRAMFITHGLKRTGKSQFHNLLSMLFGDYAGTAQAGSFHKVDQRGDAASPGLHALRNKRFVTTSEESEHAVLDTESLKRLTGFEAITTRTLYQKGHRWKPQMVLWMATNPLPQLNSDDDAIWDRVKPVPFNTRFSAKGDPGTIKETPGIAEDIFAEEAAGILNWALEGLRMFQAAGGLDQPEQVAEGVQAYRHETDPVSQFWEQMTEAGQVVPNPNEMIDFRILYEAYAQWTTSSKEYTLTSRRFGRRIRAITGLSDFHKTNGKYLVPGYAWIPRHGMLATFSTLAT